MRNLLCSISVLAFATPAFAQQAAEAPEVEGEAAPATSDDRIADIVVTASRRAESSQRTALAIDVLSSESLAKANVTRAEDLTRVAPSAQIATGGAFPQAYVRGVGNYATQSFAESAVAFNLDGVYISRTWATRGMFFDLERVEVLKGPQGTLYGRNASGGAINIITAKPKLGEVSGFVEGQAGNYNHWQGTAAINVPLGDTVAVRASGQVIDRKGYLSDGYNDDKSHAVRLQVLWEPTSDLSLLLSGNYQHGGGKGGGSVLSPQLPGDEWRGASDPAVTAIFAAEPGLGALLTSPKADGFVDIDVLSASAELNWDLGFATLTLLPAYRDSKLRTLFYLGGFPVFNHEHDRQVSVEARLGNSDGDLKWVLGGFYFDEKQQGLDGRQAMEVFQGINTQISDGLKLNTRSYAVFGQATYSVTDRFRVTGGLRYTYERKRHRELNVNFGPPDTMGPPPACVPGRTFDPATPTIPLFCRLDIAIDQQQTFNSVTYKVGVEYDLAPQSMAYASLSTGFKSGGFFSAPSPNTFRPEKLTSYEVGIKNRFFDNRLQVNLEAFYWRYRDHQESYVGPTSIPGFFTFLTANAGEAKSYGFELDTVFRPSSADELTFSIQYNGSKYDTFKYSYLTAVFGPPTTGCAVGPLVGASQEVNCAGKPLVRAPRWTGSAGYSHTFDLGSSGRLTASADVQFSSGSYLSVDFLEAGRQGAYALGNLDLTYVSDSGGLSVSAFVNNVTNKVVRNQAFRYPFVSGANPLADPDGVVLATVRPPRTYGVRARLNF